MKLNQVENRRSRLYRACIMLLLIGAVAGGISIPRLLAAKANSPANTLNPKAQSSSLHLSTTSGPPGTYIAISGSGYRPNEKVEVYWNYTGNLQGNPERNFYLFDPVVNADGQGTFHSSIFSSSNAAGNYTIAGIGLSTNIIETSIFKITSSIDIGLYIGLPGSILRLTGWGYGSGEPVNLYWNWTPTNNGKKIGFADDNGLGFFTNKTFAVPVGTPNGTYTVAGIGTISHQIAKAQFIVSKLSAGGSQTPSDWANFGYDLQNTRVNSTETTLTLANIPTLGVKWKVSTPRPNNLAASPTVANGLVYIASVQGTVSAYDITTGSQKWVFSTRGPVYGSPVIVNGIAYFGTVYYPAEGHVGNEAVALNATTGSLIWENYLPNGGEWNTPLVSNGRVFFASANKEPTNTGGTGAGGFTAFDALTGATLWSLSTSYGIWAPDTMDPTGNNLFVDTGNPCYTDPSPQLGDGCSGSVEDLDPATGKVLWKFQIPDISGDDDVAAASVYNNGHLYVGGKNGIFYAIDATNGNVLWQYDTGQRGDSGVISSAALYNNRIYFGGGDHLVHALNIIDGSVAWVYSTGDLVISSPTIANGILFVGSVDTKLYALSVATGTQVWSYSMNAFIWSSPVVSNGVVYEASGDGYLYAFSLGGV